MERTSVRRPSDEDPPSSAVMDKGRFYRSSAIEQRISRFRGPGSDHRRNSSFVLGTQRSGLAKVKAYKALPLGFID